LYLTGIEGEGNSFAEQAKYAYQEIDYLLSKSNFKSHDIFRFWNFIELIEKNYDIFNEIRKSYFQLHDIQNFPAATGIESSLINSKISLCAEGTDTAEAIQIKTLNSNLQNEASDYGPQFSRGKVLEFLDEGIKKIYISGTSNVGKNGESVFFENSDKNVKYVFECVEHLLKKESAELNDIVFSIVYSKTEEHFNVFQALYKKNNWNFPYIPLFTNICRENFFFEIECMAITTK